MKNENKFNFISDEEEIFNNNKEEEKDVTEIDEVYNELVEKDDEHEDYEHKNNDEKLEDEYLDNKIEDEHHIVKNEESYEEKNNENSKLENSIRFDEELISKDNIETTEKSSEKVESEVNNSKDSNNIGNGFYISYEMRVISMALLSILFLGFASFFIFQAVTYSESKSINYSENSSIDYKVCLDENTDYTESCLGQDMQYLSLITKNIPITFNYTAKLSSPMDYNLDYSIVGSLKIVDRDNNEKVLYTSDDPLVTNKAVSSQNDTIHFTSNVDIDFKAYNNYVTGYKSRYSLNSDAYLDVILYLNESTGSRRVSSLTIPLGVQTYGISKSQTLANNKNIVNNEKKWTSRNYISAVIGTICALVGLIILIKLITLVLKVSNAQNKYQRKLNQILREYDRVIVVARNGYEMNPNKKLIKVLSFNELLDARDALEKPVVYVKVNNVKSEFYVEDIDKVYQYVMKEADF